jgi:hypothetical protein
MSKPIKYTMSKVVKLTEVQYNTLKKLENYNVRVCDFIRDAISEKLKKEGHEIKRKKEYCPFSGLEIK